jgi:hypothetical protein
MRCQAGWEAMKIDLDLEPEEKSKIILLKMFFCILSGSFRKWHFWSPKSKKSTK